MTQVIYCFFKQKQLHCMQVIDFTHKSVRLSVYWLLSFTRGFVTGKLYAKAEKTGNTNSVQQKAANLYDVKGQVTDENANSLPGVNVLLKGSTSGTITDTDGRFSLEIPNGQSNAILVFSFVGYTTQEVSVGTQRELNVMLLPESKT